MSAAAATEHVAARRLAGRLVVTVAGQTCALRDVNAAVVRRLLERREVSTELPVENVDFAEPLGALVSIESAPRPWSAVRGWLALKPGWWALPLVLLLGALVAGSLPAERAGVAIPNTRLAWLSATVAAASVVQDVAFGLALAFGGAVRRRSKGYLLSVTRRGVHARTRDEEIEITFDAVVAVSKLRRGVALTTGGDVFVGHADDATCTRMVDAVRARIGDRARHFLA